MKKTKIPKRLAGVKMPKALREGLKQLAATESGRVVISEALEAVGRVVASNAASGPPSGIADQPKGGRRTAGDGLDSDASKVGRISEAPAPASV
jgi:hypothetical protein